MSYKNKEIIHIIIAEDHKLMRKAYKDLLLEHETYVVVGEAANGKELLDVLESTSADIILLDLEMPVMKGGEALDKIKLAYPAIKTIIVSSYYSEAFVTEYFLRGANGYLPKSCEPEELFTAINLVMEEHYYFDKSISKFLLSKMLREQRQKETIASIKLTEIELKVLKLICEEKTAKQIAGELNLTVYSIDNHRRNIQTKTQQSSAIGLFKFAIKNGITELI